MVTDVYFWLGFCGGGCCYFFIDVVNEVNKIWGVENVRELWFLIFNIVFGFLKIWGVEVAEGISF